MIEADLRDWQDLENALALANERGIPHATRATVNNAAFEAMGEAKQNIGSKFTIRRPWVKKQVIVKKASGNNIDTQEALVGSPFEGLADQESGKTITAKGRHGVSIPTGYSAGQEGQRPRTRLPRTANRMQNINLRRRRGRSKKQQNMIAVKQAASSGNKYVFLDTGRRQYVAKVIGGVRSPKVKMVADLSKKTIRIPETKWFEPAVENAQRKMPRFYADALVFQLRRVGLLP
jgi:hypothetical protein